MHQVLTFIYQIGLAIALIFLGPVFLLRKKTRTGIFEKLGFVPEDIKKSQRENKGCIWIHAVSVGEFNAVYPLVKKLKEELPGTPIAISTTTATGQSIAKEKAGDIATIFYFPFDLPFCLTPWFEVLDPALAIIVETEIWPGFIEECERRSIPILSVNARISPKSFLWYHRLRFFFGPLLKKFSAIGAQTRSEHERFTKIGASSDTTEILGNIKLDGLKPLPEAELKDLAESLNIGPDDFVIVAGSTHEGEEEAVLKVLEALQAMSSKETAIRNSIKLIIAPRHPERFERAATIIEQHGFKARRFSKSESFSTEGNEVYLLDGLGQLVKFYSLASVAFVGGTIAPIGGHNVAEPYAYRVPVCCGPNIQKTKDIAYALNECGALLMASDAENLIKRVKEVYLDRDKARSIGEKGAAWLKENQGAVDRAYNMIASVYKNTP